ncbi:Uncharacterised protein [Actinomyces howellii]|uniref:DUF6318 domain-containing protein n=2 Tax=Actinomyces howellii TaxID=52771 RepID=A0A448HGF6_9ACTO|nr:Uncharacterised protein [Actinomyces howellii]
MRVSVIEVVLDCLRCDGVSRVRPCSGLISDGGGLMSWFMTRLARSRQRVGALACTLVLVAAAGVGGCSDSGADSATPSPKARPSASGAAPTSSTPVESASGQAPAQASESGTPSSVPPLSSQQQASYDAAMATPEPSRVDGMDEHSPYGASQAAGYFLQLYPYVFATGDLNAWEGMSEDGCDFCSSVSEGVREMHDSGGWAEPWTPEISIVSYGTDPADPERHVIETRFLAPAHKTYSGRPGTVSNIEARDVAIYVQVRWQGDRWAVEGVKVE